MNIFKREDGFNNKSRTVNSAKIAGLGVFNNILNLILSFVYRTVFLLVLSKEYLGINGLFTNVLNVLSIAELGIGAAIVYRMYSPIALNDPEKLGRIMCFYKTVYRIIAVSVLILGLCIMPFIKFLIKDLSELPPDINIYVIYALFLFNSVSSYLFIYKTSIFSADQKGYIGSIFGMVSLSVSTGIKIAILFLTKSFFWALTSGIVVSLTFNILQSMYAHYKYAFVFKHKGKLEKETIKSIKKDTFALLIHKIGGTVVFSTDNILLSTFIGIGVLGVYSNYSMITVAVTGVLGQILTAFTAGIGNINVLDKENLYATYRKLEFFDLCVSSVCGIMMFALLNPFIETWQGSDMLLDIEVVSVLAASFFITASRNVNMSFISACGLFMKDKLRPLFEVVINLVVSIALLKLLGVIGIFLGTIISSVCTVFWREPYLLYKHLFGKNFLREIAVVLVFFAFSCGMALAVYSINNLMPNTWGYFIAKFLIAFTLPTVSLTALTFRTKEFRSLFESVRNLLKRKSKHVN